MFMKKQSFFVELKLEAISVEVLGYHMAVIAYFSI